MLKSLFTFLLASIAFVLLTGVPLMATTIVSSGALNLPIDDRLPPTTHTLVVPDSFIITDVNVTLNITHTFDGDLDISLEGPSSTTVLLADNDGGSGNDFLNTIFDDEGINGPIGLGSPPYTGAFIPNEALAAFDGQNAAGNWTLIVTDTLGGDSGRLIDWSLTLEGDAAAVPEPSTFFLGALGVGALLLRRRIVSHKQ